MKMSRMVISKEELCHPKSDEEKEDFIIFFFDREVCLF